MLHNISWFRFGMISLFAVIVYYLAIAILYYRKRALALLIKPKSKGNLFAGLSVPEDTDEGLPGLVLDEPDETAKVSPHVKKQEPDLYPIANELVESIDEFIAKAGQKEQVREEVMFGIQQIIGKYPIIKSSGFKTAINNYILIAIKGNCHFSVEDSELETLWID